MTVGPCAVVYTPDDILYGLNDDNIVNWTFTGSDNTYRLSFQGRLENRKVEIFKNQDTAPSATYLLKEETRFHRPIGIINDIFYFSLACNYFRSYIYGYQATSNSLKRYYYALDNAVFVSNRYVVDLGHNSTLNDSLSIPGPVRVFDLTLPKEKNPRFHRMPNILGYWKYRVVDQEMPQKAKIIVEGGSDNRYEFPVHT